MKLNLKSTSGILTILSIIALILFIVYTKKPDIPVYSVIKPVAVSSERVSCEDNTRQLCRKFFVEDDKEIQYKVSLQTASQVKLGEPLKVVVDYTRESWTKEESTLLAYLIMQVLLFCGVFFYAIITQDDYVYYY